jgi:hypothetical protein
MLGTEHTVHTLWGKSKEILSNPRALDEIHVGPMLFEESNEKPDF